MGKDINRIKAVLVETGRTNVGFAEQLGDNPTTASQCYAGISQPDLRTLPKIAELLNVSHSITDRREDCGDGKVEIYQCGFI